MQKGFICLTPHRLLADLGFLTLVRMLTDNMFMFRPPLPLPRRTRPRPLQLPLGTAGIRKPGRSCLTRPGSITH